VPAYPGQRPGTGCNRIIQQGRCLASWREKKGEQKGEVSRRREGAQRGTMERGSFAPSQESGPAPRRDCRSPKGRIGLVGEVPMPRKRGHTPRESTIDKRVKFRYNIAQMVNHRQLHNTDARSRGLSRGAFTALFCRPGATSSPFGLRPSSDCPSHPTFSQPGWDFLGPLNSAPSSSAPVTYLRIHDPENPRKSWGFRPFPLFLESEPLRPERSPVAPPCLRKGQEPRLPDLLSSFAPWCLCEKSSFSLAKTRSRQEMEKRFDRGLGGAYYRERRR